VVMITTSITVTAGLRWTAGLRVRIDSRVRIDGRVRIGGHVRISGRVRVGVGVGVITRARAGSLLMVAPLPPFSANGRQRLIHFRVVAQSI
jgi:UDP-3-O-[3-hydroxymyristoyl] glucosamine N-acyltransferase